MKFKLLFYTKRLNRRKSLAYLIVLIVLAVFSFFEFIDESEFEDKSKFTDEQKFFKKDTYCRIGMSHRPVERINYWIKEYKRKQHTVIKCEIIDTYESKKEAQRAETKNIKAQGCEGNPGGRGPKKAKWSVYKLTISKEPLDNTKTSCHPKTL